MNILIICNSLDLSGSGTYTSSLSSALVKRGWEVHVFSLSGEPAMIDQLKKGGARVFISVKQLPTGTYDIIIAQHSLPAMLVRRHLLDVPMVYISHGILPVLEHPPVVDLNIQFYIAVSEEIKTYIINKHKIDPAKVYVIRNIIDTETFFPTTAINTQPRKALFISKKYDPVIHRNIKEACRICNIDLKVLGAVGFRSNRRVDNIEEYINEADLVFSLGRGALEAMACGRAVIVYDYLGADGILTEENIDEVQKNNFSGRRYGLAFSVKDLVHEIRKYSHHMGVFNRNIILQRFSEDVIVNDIADICQSAVNSFKPKRHYFGDKVEWWFAYHSLHLKLKIERYQSRVRKLFSLRKTILNN